MALAMHKTLPFAISGVQVQFPRRSSLKPPKIIQRECPIPTQNVETKTEGWLPEGLFPNKDVFLKMCLQGNYDAFEKIIKDFSKAWEKVIAIKDKSQRLESATSLFYQEDFNRKPVQAPIHLVLLSGSITKTIEYILKCISIREDFQSRDHINHIGRLDKILNNVLDIFLQLKDPYQEQNLDKNKEDLRFYCLNQLTKLQFSSHPSNAAWAWRLSNIVKKLGST